MTEPGNSEGWINLIPSWGQLIVPAVVAAIVTFLLNRRLESRRGKRELNSRAFDTARESVAKFAELTSLYWTRGSNESDVERETRIMLAESDLRINVTDAIELVSSANHELLQTAFDDLLRFGTGGQFQSSGRNADIARCRRISGAAALLQGQLVRERRSLLSRKGL